MAGYDWLEASERLKAAILARFGTYAEFARRIPMEATQLTATLKPHRRPTVETLDRFSVVLGWSPNTLRGWYGYVLAEVEITAEPVPPAEVAGALDPERCVAYVEEYPDAEFVRDALAVRARLPYADYVEWCVSICQAWRSNGKLAITAVRMGR